MGIEPTTTGITIRAINQRYVTDALSQLIVLLSKIGEFSTTKTGINSGMIFPS